MADVEDSLWTQLTDDSAVTAIIVKRLYDGTAPAKVKVPYGVHRRISTVRPQAFGSSPGNVHARIEYTWIETTPKKARTLAAAARGAIHRFSAPSGTPVIEDVFLDNESEPEVRAQDRRFELIQDYLVFYRE